MKEKRENKKIESDSEIILNSHLIFPTDTVISLGAQFPQIKAAMEEYATQKVNEYKAQQNSDWVAVGFAEWITDNDFTWETKFWQDVDGDKVYTHKQLFAEYKLSPEYKAIAELSGQRGKGEDKKEQV